MKPLYFSGPAEFRRWLDEHHATRDELVVGFHKRATGKPSLTWPESVDEALCYGWIDGIRRRVDADRYTIRFTPRRAGSIWSAVNIRRVGKLSKLGRMRPAGLAAFKKRTKNKSGIYSFEQRGTLKLPAAYLRQFRKNADAWRFFSSQPPWYQRTTTWLVISAKKEETRLRRLALLIRDSAAGRRIGILKQSAKPNKPGSRAAREPGS
ncbi:MAG: YdeI/OmpD-associated family protein [Acidobacteriota bacterium]